MKTEVFMKNVSSKVISSINPDMNCSSRV